jgi:cobalt-zinc-cadmium efflux system outer membrane protein
MQVSPFQLLASKQQQIDTANAYVRALHAYWLARSELDQILSGRTASFDPLPATSQTPRAAQREGH